MTYESVTADLRLAYDRDAARRDAAELQPWKIEERRRFLEHMRAEECRTLLEVGAGPGVHARFFADAGLDVTCTDLSPEHVRLCLAKGLKARVMDFLSLDFVGEERFDAVMAMNCLLHVPRLDLPRALASIDGVLKPGGLFYLGQYGGIDSEGVNENDDYEPKRFFSFLTDEGLEQVASELFEVEEYWAVRTDERDDGSGIHYQSLLLRKPLEDLG